MRGERGQPCLTPRKMSIQMETLLPKDGATLTSEREEEMKRVTQEGKPTLLRTFRAQVWSMESKALAVSRKNKRRWVLETTPWKKN